jgi:predicted CXXCH cytochrome family protein
MGARGRILALCVALLLEGGGIAFGDRHPGACTDCHASGDDGAHDLNAPLWSSANTEDGLPYFTLYSSKTFDALHTDIGQPDGASKLCLGCHDGSYPGLGSGSHLVFGPSDLAGSHPVSFTYDSALWMRVRDGSLADPLTAPSGLGGSIDQDLLDDEHKLQCTSCHEVHATGYGKALLRYADPPGTYTTLCRTCHRR